MEILSINRDKTENLDLKKLESATSNDEIREIISEIACKSLKLSSEHKKLLTNKVNGIKGENIRLDTLDLLSKCFKSIKATKNE